MKIARVIEIIDEELLNIKNNYNDIPLFIRNKVIGDVEFEIRLLKRLKQKILKESPK